MQVIHRYKKNSTIQIALRKRICAYNSEVLGIDQEEVGGKRTGAHSVGYKVVDCHMMATSVCHKGGMHAKSHFIQQQIK
jgi:hypothetical protein